MEFNQWLAVSKEYQHNVTLASKKLQEIIGNHKSSMGFVNEEIRALPEFKQAKKVYAICHEQMANFNAKSPKQYFKQAQDLRRAEWKK